MKEEQRHFESSTAPLESLPIQTHAVVDNFEEIGVSNFVKLSLTALGYFEAESTAYDSIDKHN